MSFLSALYRPPHGQVLRSRRTSPRPKHPSLQQNKYPEMHRLVREAEGSQCYTSVQRTGPFRFRWFRVTERGISIPIRVGEKFSSALSERTSPSQLKCAMNLRRQQKGALQAKPTATPLEISRNNSTCATPRMLPTLALQTMRFSEATTFRPRCSAATQP